MAENDMDKDIKMRCRIGSVIQMASYRQVKNVNNGTDFTNDITGSGKL